MTEKRSSEVLLRDCKNICGHPKTSLVPGIQDPLHATAMRCVLAFRIGITPKDSLWIGAWWLPFTIIAALSLLNAIPMWGYAEDLPGISLFSFPL